MKIQKKHWIFGAVALLILGITTYFAAKWYQIKKAYQKKLSEAEVVKMVNDKTKDLSPEMEIDDTILKAQQNTNNGTNITAAVLINNIVYIFNPSTYLFDNANDYYDPENDSLIIGNNAIYQNPNDVTAGTVDETGKFTF